MGGEDGGVEGGAEEKGEWYGRPPRHYKGGEKVNLSYASSGS